MAVPPLHAVCVFLDGGVGLYDLSKRRWNFLRDFVSEFLLGFGFRNLLLGFLKFVAWIFEIRCSDFRNSLLGFSKFVAWIFKICCLDFLTLTLTFNSNECLTLTYWSVGVFNSNVSV